MAINGKDKASSVPSATPSREADAEPRAPVRGAAGELAARSSDADVGAFLARLKQSPGTGKSGGRLIFAMDATMSRQPTWDMALALQADMFGAVAAIGGLEVQLVYFRGAGECRASKWVGNPQALAALMTRVACAGGYTQIRKVLSHAQGEAAARAVDALIYVGDAMEEEIDDLCGRAGELALRKVPVFLFQEGTDQRAERAFREIARLTKGAYCRFDAGSAAQLKALLSAVAVYATGGRRALAARTDAAARRLIEQLK
ncbi:MAG TPA: VWA domain-containing protein [Hyphomicrobiaceae bacterium]|nr:VWA domain-containing protein [Hyphomicrobiaceae bacterium]